MINENISKEGGFHKYPLLRTIKFLTINEQLELLKLNKNIRKAILSYSKLLKLYMHHFNCIRRDTTSNPTLCNHTIVKNLFGDDFKIFFDYLQDYSDIIKIKENLKLNLEATLFIKIVNYFNLYEDLNENFGFIKCIDLEEININNKGNILLTEFFRNKDNLYYGAEFRGIKLSNNNNLTNCEFFTEVFGKNSNINYLDLSSNPISVLDITNLFSKNLNTNSNEMSFKNFPLYLNFRYCNLNSEHIQTFSELIRYKLKHSQQGMENCVLIKSLKLDGNTHINNLEHLADLLPDNIIEELSLNYSNLGPSVFKILFEKLKLNNSLVKLEICKNKLDNEGGLYISEVFKVKQNFTFIDLRSNRFDDISGEFICKYFKTMPNLKTLRLSFNYLSEKSAIQLSELLSSPLCKIEELLLGPNEFSDKSCKYLMNSLKVNNSVTYLDLSSIQITKNKVGSYIADMLKVNKKLNYLELVHNKLGKGTKDVFNSLIANKSLIYLGLNSNDVSEYSLDKLLDLIRSNKTLKKLDIGANLLNRTSIYNIKEALQQNKDLEIKMFGNEEGVDNSMNEY